MFTLLIAPLLAATPDWYRGTCINAPEADVKKVALCLGSGDIALDQRLLFLKRAAALAEETDADRERLRGELAQVMVDEPALQEGLWRVLVSLGHLSPAAAMPPLSGELDAALARSLVAHPDEDIRTIRSSACRVLPQDSGVVITYECDEFLGCVGACVERWGVVTMRFETSWELVSVAEGHGDAGRCGCCEAIE